MKEIWKNIEGFEGFYQISNYGRVKSEKVGIRQPSVSNKGYHIYRLKYKDIDVQLLAHRLVAEYFIPKVEGKDVVNHKDNNPSNNHVDNLEWCTQSDNIKYAIKQGRYKHHIENCIKNNLKRQKKVEQYNLEGELIAIYESVAEASKSVDTAKGNISRGCNGKAKTVKGFVWKYAE